MHSSSTTTAAASPNSKKKMYFHEIHTCDLPSQTTCYSSAKTVIATSPSPLLFTANNDYSKIADDEQNKNVIVGRMASEHHALKIIRKSSSRHHVGGDAYGVAFSKLPKLKIEKSLMKKRKRTCIAHSYLPQSDDGECMEAFALLLSSPEEENETNENTDAEQQQQHAEGINATSSSGGDGAATTNAEMTKKMDSDDTESLSKPAAAKESSADATNKEGTSTTTAGKVTTPKHKENIHKSEKETSSLSSEKATARPDNSKACLVIQTNHHRSKNISKFLSYRPLVFHMTTIALTTKETEKENNNTVGIFVGSADDTKLRLYMLHSKTKNDDNCTTSIEEASMIISKDDQITQKPDMNNDEQREEEREDWYHHEPFVDENTTNTRRCMENDPFSYFTSPIMAIHSLIVPIQTQTEGGEIYYNYLAVACQDGTIRIITYEVTSKNDDIERQGGQEHNVTSKDDNNESKDEKRSSSLLLKCTIIDVSTFVVDGPIVSLHLSTSPPPSSHIQYQKDSICAVYLVVGSLCGFVCLFRQIIQTHNNDNDDDNDELQQQRYNHQSSLDFDGPFVVTSGLYNGKLEVEDSVMAVCKFPFGGTKGGTAIAVGTHSGRVLFFEPTSSVGENKDEKSVSVEKTGIREEEDDDEKDGVSDDENNVEGESRGTNENRIKNDNEEMVPSSDSIKDELNLLHERISENSEDNSSDNDDDGDDRNDADGVGQEEEIEQDEDTSKDESTTNNNNDDDAKEEPSNNITSSISQYGLPEIPRYKLFWRCKLPYPIHGLAVEDIDGDGLLELLISTRRSVHVYRADAAIIAEVTKQRILDIFKDRNSNMDETLDK